MSENGPADHQHLFRIAMSGKLAIRFCERCGRSWLISEREILQSGRAFYAWSEILEASQVDQLTELLKADQTRQQQPQTQPQERSFLDRMLGIYPNEPPQ